MDDVSSIAGGSVLPLKTWRHVVVTADGEQLAVLRRREACCVHTLCSNGSQRLRYVLVRNGRQSDSSVGRPDRRGGVVRPSTHRRRNRGALSHRSRGDCQITMNQTHHNVAEIFDMAPHQFVFKLPAASGDCCHLRHVPVYPFELRACGNATRTTERGVPGCRRHERLCRPSGFNAQRDYTQH